MYSFSIGRTTDIYMIEIYSMFVIALRMMDNLKILRKLLEFINLNVLNSYIDCFVGYENRCVKIITLCWIVDFVMITGLVEEFNF